MAHSAPGKHYRKGLTLVELFKMFPDDETAEQWFIQVRWPDGITCPSCDSRNVFTKASHKTMPYRCNDCKKRFSVKTDSIMQSSKLGYQKWAIAMYLVTTNLKSVSSLKLHRDLGITQQAAWHMLHRIRKAYMDSDEEPFDGEVEVDESYFGGKEANKHAKKKLKAGRRAVGKTAVVGMKDRKSNRVKAEVVKRTDRRTLQLFVLRSTSAFSTVYNDDALAYRGLPRQHVTVRHSVGEYVRRQAYTNGLESFWATMKRGYHGVYHHMTPKHLHRYLAEFQGRHNNRPLDTEEQMRAIVEGSIGKLPRYKDLIAETG